MLDLADGWAHVRMGMEGDSLEGYIRQERLKYGAEAMRAITQYASMPGFESDVIIYQACDEQFGHCGGSARAVRNQNHGL